MGYEFWVTMGVTAIMASIKNAESKAKVKQIVLALYRAIQMAYAGDPDFGQPAFPSFTAQPEGQTYFNQLTGQWEAQPASTQQL